MRAYAIGFSSGVVMNLVLMVVYFLYFQVFFWMGWISTIQLGPAYTLLSADAVPLWGFSRLLGIGISIAISGLVCDGYVAVLGRIRSSRDPVDGRSPRATNDLQLPAP